jgi:septum site-determining protein MinD
MIFSLKTSRMLQYPRSIALFGHKSAHLIICSSFIDLLFSPKLKVVQSTMHKKDRHSICVLANQSKHCSFSANMSKTLVYSIIKSHKLNTLVSKTSVSKIDNLSLVKENSFKEQFYPICEKESSSINLNQVQAATTQAKLGPRQVVTTPSLGPPLQGGLPGRVDAISSRKVEHSPGEQSSSFSSEQDSRTIVITSGKGGVGKTTATANLGMSIARLGYRVALIDADIGLRNLDLLLGLENRVLYTAMDIFEGECRLDQALIRDKRLKNLCLLAISKNRQRYNVTRQKMDNLVSSISALGYHFILIDCPAGIDVGFINAISPAQEALIVTTPEITSMRDADRVAGLLEANGIYNAKLLINRVRPDMIQRHDMMSVQDVQDVLGIPLLGAIPEDLHVIVSTNRGEPLVLRKKLTLSGIAFENAARRLIGKQDYLIDLKTPYKGIFQKMKTIFFNN